MSPELVKFSRIMRLVVLVGFTIYMLMGGTWVHYLFAGVCALIAALTVWQMWDAHQRGE